MKPPFINNRLPKYNLILASGVLILLSFFTSLYFRMRPSLNKEVDRLQQYIHHQQKDFDEVLQDTRLLQKLVQHKETLEEFKQVAEKKYGFYLYAGTVSDKQELLFWNNHDVLPPAENYPLREGTYFKRLANGYYVMMKKPLRLPGMTSPVFAYALIPVLYQFDFETDYLRTHFVHDESATKRIVISEKKTPYVVRSDNTFPLFYVAANEHMPKKATHPITLILRIAALLFVLAYTYFVAESITIRKGPIRSVLFLALVLLAVRILFFIFPGLFYFRQFQLFDPAIYSSNWFNRSLGDLLINAIIFCLISVFAWYNTTPVKRIEFLMQGKRIYVTGLLALFVLILSTFQLANTVRSLVADSRISFNVSDVFSLNLYTIVSFIVLALLSLTYYYFTRLLFRFIFPAFEEHPVYIYFVIALAGLIVLTFRSGSSIVLFYIPVLIWLLIYTLLVSQEKFIINHVKINMISVLFWIFIFSISLSAVIVQENKNKEWIRRKSIAEKHDELTDPSQERTLSIALNYLDMDFLSGNFERFTNPDSSRALRDSIINDNLMLSYRSAYNTKIFVFDSLNRGLFNEDPLTYGELNNIFTVRSKPTGIPDLYYHQTSFDNLTYITKRTIYGETDFLGTFFIISTPKKYSAETFYPEIFRQMKQTDVEDIATYSYAIYKNKLLISYSNQYPFKTSLNEFEIPVNEFERRENGDYDELWYKASSIKVVIIARKQVSLVEGITLFSYLFCAFLLMVALLQAVATVLHTTIDLRNFHLFSQLSIRRQVHGTIIFVSILSILIIGFATISIFIARYNRNNIDKLNRTSGIMVREMQKRLGERGKKEMSDIYDSVSSYHLQKLVEEVSDIHNVDVNVYDTKGDLRVSSRADVYKIGVLSSKIHPEAFYHLNRLRQVNFVQEETLSSLSYLSIYAPVRDQSGLVYAYLNIPYFLSQIDLNQEISNFLVTLINLNAFIILIAGVIALFVTNKITRSFSIIGEKMREITLGGTNEEIVWGPKDEIGELVQHYNKMVRQLEQSAEALAKSEREGAWREMARQVAHEIKNPLTPMKLSIQYLQKAINNNQPNIQELTSRVANTLVEQIDHLSKIAADFSRFANIGNQNRELFDLQQVIASLVDLHKTNPKIHLHWNNADGPVWIMADKTHINRLFTNLLTNAVEACMNQPDCSISINEVLNENTVLISIKDNGEGIPPDMQSKIFVPNFTTKTSGTGLGLAMCKRIVEQAGGDIWFETELGKGTTFFVELPVSGD